MIFSKASLLLIAATVPYFLFAADAKSLGTGKDKAPGRRSSTTTSRLLTTPPPPHDKNPVLQSCWYEEAVSPNYDDDNGNGENSLNAKSSLTRPVSSSSSSRRRGAAKQSSKGSRTTTTSSIFDTLRGGSSTSATVTTTTVTSTTTTAPVVADGSSSSSSVASIAAKSSSKLSMFIAKQAMKQTAAAIQNQFIMLKNGELTTKEIVLTFGVIITVIAAISQLVMMGDSICFFGFNGTCVDTWLCFSCIVLGPLAAILQRKVFILEDLRDITNQMENQVLELQTSNSKLQKQNERLQANTER